MSVQLGQGCGERQEGDPGLAGVGSAGLGCLTNPGPRGRRGPTCAVAPWVGCGFPVRLFTGISLLFHLRRISQDRLARTPTAFAAHPLRPTAPPLSWPSQVGHALDVGTSPTGNWRVLLLFGLFLLLSAPSLATSFYPLLSSNTY